MTQNVRRYFDSSKVRGEGNSVLIINREILPGQVDAPICFTFLTTTRDFSEIQRSVLLQTETILLFFLFSLRLLIKHENLHLQENF